MLRGNYGWYLLPWLGYSLVFFCRCINFSCPLNTVPGHLVDAYLDRNPRMWAAIPLNQPLRIVARVTRDIRRIYEGTAELKLPDGTVAVEATGKYFSLTGKTLPAEELEAQEWRVYPAEGDPRELEI